MSRTSLLISYLSRIFAPFTNLITSSINKYGTGRTGDMDGDNEITEADIQALTAWVNKRVRFFQQKEKLLTLY